jgi:hypothetical protein
LLLARSRRARRVHGLSLHARPPPLSRPRSRRSISPSVALAIRRVTDHWRQRAANYHGLQRAATAFRDQLWSLVGDFEDATKLSPKDFLQLSRMERQIAAKEVKPDHDLFSQIQFSVRSHLFWEFLDDVLASKEIK